MCAASAATGVRTWLQTHHFGWLTPRRMRALTIAVMSGAAIFSTIGFSGSTPGDSACLIVRRHDSRRHGPPLSSASHTHEPTRDLAMWVGEAANQPCV
jgi:hypothetical protein